MTLTHNCNTPWADSNVDPGEHNGLTGSASFSFIFSFFFYKSLF